MNRACTFRRKLDSARQRAYELAARSAQPVVVFRGTAGFLVLPETEAEADGYDAAEMLYRVTPQSRAEYGD